MQETIRRIHNSIEQGEKIQHMLSERIFKDADGNNLRDIRDTGADMLFVAISSRKRDFLGALERDDEHSILYGCWWFV